VRASSFDEARYAAKLREPCRVRRVWGGLGLMCDLFLEELERGANFCKFCGAPLRRHGRYCARKDSLACFLQGRAEDRRLQRRGGEWGESAD
jgi:hypothetical protein